MNKDLKNKDSEAVSVERIENAILLLRDHKVMLDRDLAALYGVTTGNLNKAVRCNLDRFPQDFMFQLTPDEADSLSFQFGSLNPSPVLPADVKRGILLP